MGEGMATSADDEVETEGVAAGDDGSTVDATTGSSIDFDGIDPLTVPLPAPIGSFTETSASLFPAEVQLHAVRTSPAIKTWVKSVAFTTAPVPAKLAD
jgi:hypothetical protein